MEPMKPAGFYMKEVNPERKIVAGEGPGNRANIVQFDEHLETTDKFDIVSGETKFEDAIKEVIKENSVPVEGVTLRLTSQRRTNLLISQKRH